MLNKVSGIASVALLASLSVAGASPSAGATSTVLRTASDDCESRALALIPSYLEDQGLLSNTDVYTACTNDIATVWVADDAGKPIDPLSDEPEASARGERMQAREVEDNTCKILNNYSVECNWGTTYRKLNGTAVVWKRSLSSYALMNLQSISHSVKLRYTHDQGIGHDAMGDVILQRQQGILPPTYENDTDFYFDGGTQTTGTVWVNREDTSAGKYSMIFNLTSVFDEAENVYIPILGDPTSPRFQCYSDVGLDLYKNCEFPDGKEAPIF